jgi:hypothetical protein
VAAARRPASSSRPRASRTSRTSPAASTPGRSRSIPASRATEGAALAKQAIPDPLERRHLVEGALEPARALKIAEAYVAGGRALEAVAFLAKAGARERIEALWQTALAEGDAFLLREVAAALGREPDAAAWRTLAENAAAAGKDRYAAEGRRQAERLANR